MSEKIACPDCYGGHFRPCQICGDSGTVEWICGGHKQHLKYESQLTLAQERIAKLEEALEWLATTKTNYCLGRGKDIYKPYILSEPTTDGNIIFMTISTGDTPLEAIQNAMKSALQSPPSQE